MRDSEAKEVPRRLTSETGPRNLARRCSKAPGDALAFSAGSSTKRTALAKLAFSSVCELDEPWPRSPGGRSILEKFHEYPDRYGEG